MLGKAWLRNQLLKLPFAVTKNIGNDQLTIKVIKKVLDYSSNCIDVGCHKGEISDCFIKYASKGNHFGFEPLPFLYEHLLTKYKDKNVSIYPFALSDTPRKSSFNYVKTNPAYSGLIKRKYDHENEIDEVIHVEVEKLDNVISHDIKIDFIKIDTEGGEFGVLLGGKEIINKWQPVILFEFGIGASDYYGTTPKMVFEFFDNLKMKLFTQSQFVNNGNYFNLDEFENCYNYKKEYIFVASKI